MACNYKVLAYNDNGYVIRCSRCNHYQIGFGTMVVSLSDEEYIQFGREVQEQLDFYQYDGFPYQKIIQLNTFSKNAHMTLTFNELLKLSTIIAEANLILQVDAILAGVDQLNR